MANPNPVTAWKALQEGNERFVAGAAEHPDQSVEHRARLTAGQHPFAAVLGCSDSRAPVELLFDQGLGDLFVVRTAGQVLDAAVLGSLETPEEFEARHATETAAQLLARSATIADGVAAGTLAIVGATYELADGRVVVHDHFGDVGLAA
jgi:carbonic anhydrase